MQSNTKVIAESNLIEIGDDTANGRPTVKALRLGARDVRRVRRAFESLRAARTAHLSRPGEVRRPLTALEHRAAAGASRLLRYDPNEPVSPSCPGVPAELLAVDAELRKLERRVDLKGDGLPRPRPGHRELRKLERRVDLKGPRRTAPCNRDAQGVTGRAPGRRTSRTSLGTRRCST